MNWFRMVGLWMAGLAWMVAEMGCAYAADGEEKPSEAKTVVIPLDQIWAWRMPGTRPMEVGQRDGSYVSDEGPMLDEIRQYLSKPWRPKVKTARAGFVVLGTDMEAMRRAHAVLVGNEEPRKIFPVESTLSLVFFSHSSTWYTYLHRVEQKGNHITVRYRFEPHQTANTTKHFALIPLRDLDTGEYHVSFVKSPMEQRLIDMGWKPRLKSSRELVCHSFSFTIKENLKN